MSRQVLRYVMNGIVEVNGARYYRICDLGNNQRALEFLRQPAALVLIEPGDERSSFEKARAVWNALNASERERIELFRAVTPAERSALTGGKR